VIRSSARGSYRLQKSTGGAWPFTPGGEESPDHDDGSSPSARECRRGERASEAGSSVAKPRNRWRVPNKPVGLRERHDQGATCRGKALRIGKIILLDERVVEAILAPRKRPGDRVAAGCDRERQRSDVSLVPGRQSQAEVASLASFARISRAERQTRTVYGPTEAGDAPSSACPAGAGSPQGGLATHGRTRPSGRGRTLRSAQRELRARKSSDHRVLVS